MVDQSYTAQPSQSGGSMRRAELHDRLEALYHRLRDFPEGARCEHGMHLKRDAYVAFLELRKLIENELLPALARNTAGIPNAAER